MIEVKADGLEASFEALEQDDDGVAALKAELALLKKRIDEGVIAAQRPALDGVKSAASASAFVEQYLRKGIESGLEQKAVGSSTDAIGGYAVPREIDEKIDRTLVAISPIRSIANVVKVGTAGYRKLVTTGGTPSGWVGFEAARPMTEYADVQRDRAGVGRALRQSGGVAADARRCDVRRRGLAGQRDRDRVRAGRGDGVRQGHRHQPAARLPELAQRGDARTGCGRWARCSSIGTGVSAAFPASNPQDKIARPGPVAAPAVPPGRGVRDEFGDGDGGAQVQDRATAPMSGSRGWSAGQPATLLGYPVIEAEDMPDVAANSLSIAFGNFKAGYTIAERNATTDPARSVHQQALRPFLRDQAGRRAGGEFGKHQAAEVHLTT